MGRFFTHYWSYDRNDLEGYVAAGAMMDHTPGSLFVRRGVKAGDFVYVFSVKRGVLYLLGKLQVGEIVFSTHEAEKRLQQDNLWEGPEHLIASCCTPAQLIDVPIQVVEKLQFETASGQTTLKFVEPGELDPQTIRGVRELTYDSALELDRLLPAMEPLSVGKT